MKHQFVAYSEFINPECDWIIGIDVGHSGIVDGVYDTAPKKMYDHGDYIFYEGVYNRAIGLHLSGLLLESNISHYFTTDSNYDVGLSIRTTRINNFVRKYPDKKHLSISIHGNAFGKDLSVRGIETFSCVTKTGSDKKTRLLRKESATYRDILHKHVSEIGWKDRGVKKANYHMTREPKCPSILIELGFYTNREEADLMSKNSIQGKFAELLRDGIKEIVD